MPPLGLSEALALFQSLLFKGNGSVLPSGDAVGDAEGADEGVPIGDAEGVASGVPVGVAEGVTSGDFSVEGLCTAAGEGVDEALAPPSPVPFGEAVGTVPTAPSPAAFDEAVGVGVASPSPLPFGEAVSIFASVYDSGVILASDTSAIFFIFPIPAAWVGKAHVAIRPNASSQAVIRFIGLVLLFFCSLSSSVDDIKYLSVQGNLCPPV